MTRTPSIILDELLVVQAQSGDRAAFNTLAARWQPRHLAHAGRLVGRTGAAADAVQDAWIAIVRGLVRLRDPARFRAWSMAIVTRRCRDAQRRAYRAPDTVEIDEHHGQLAPTDGTHLDLRRALAALPVNQRAAVGLYYVDGFTVGEIAEALNTPAGTIKTRLHHARRALRQTLEGHSS